MINPNNLLIINDDGDTSLPIEAIETAFNAAEENANRQINHWIMFNNNLSIVEFGQTVPFHADVCRILNFQCVMNCLGIMVLLVLILLVGMWTTSNTSASGRKDASTDEHQDLLMKTQNGYKLSISNDDKILVSMASEESNVQGMLEETKVTDDSTCVFYDIFLHTFVKLCSLKNNIMSTVQLELQNNRALADTPDEKTGRARSSTTATNDAVSNTDD